MHIATLLISINAMQLRKNFTTACLLFFLWTSSLFMGINHTVFAQNVLSSLPKEFKTLRCTACHHQSQKKIGPSFLSIAKKYNQVELSQAYLEIKIKSGSQGVWGSIPMPANTQVSNEQAKTMAQHILDLSPKP